jgi:hypothetical protein
MVPITLIPLVTLFPSIENAYLIIRHSRPTLRVAENEILKLELPAKRH